MAAELRTNSTTPASTSLSSSSSSKPQSPSLLDHLSKSISTFAGTHDYSIQVLRSQPRRSHALFPHASNVKTVKVWQEEVIVLLSEKRKVPSAPRPAPVASTSEGEGGKTENHGETRPMGEETEVQEYLPIVGIEASIYTIPSTSSSLVYISKVDTSGLAPSGFAPTRQLVSAFVGYAFKFPPHAMTRVRIYTFAKSHGQYLFPGSKENEKKRVLDDQGLIRWWKATLEAGVSAVTAAVGGEDDDKTRMFYLVPGLDYLESLPYVPASSTSALPLAQAWVYGHPYSTLASPLHSASSAPSSAPLTDHIPSFPDDPKARFHQSLTSSTIAAAGNEGDYDDVMLSLGSATFANGQTPTQRIDAIERDRERERRRLIEGVPGGVEEWWERMAYRQECCSGVLVAFFVLARGEEKAKELEHKTGETDKGIAKPMKRYEMAIPHASFTKLWSQFHNVDYAEPALHKAAIAAKKWREDVERITMHEEMGEEQSEAARYKARKKYDKVVMRQVEVRNPERPIKRWAEGDPSAMGADGMAAKNKPVVNMLAPRKKKKPAPSIPDVGSVA